MDSESESTREAYLRGRLLGLNDLIEVLSETLEKGGENSLSKNIVAHISGEVEDLLREFKVNAPKHEAQALEKIGEKHEDLKKSIEESKPEEDYSEPVVREQVKKADELMKSLLEVKGQGS